MNWCFHGGPYLLARQEDGKLQILSISREYVFLLLQKLVDLLMKMKKLMVGLSLFIICVLKERVWKHMNFRIEMEKKSSFSCFRSGN